MRCTSALVGTAALVAAVTALPAHAAFTVATFADPAQDSSTPLFELDGSTLTGGWNSTGMTLQTPGLGGANYTDAGFSMTPLTVSGTFPSYTVSGGSIEFTDSIGNEIFTISFDGGFLLGSLGFGASEFTGQGVSFTGPAITSPLSQESFSFAFANPEPTAGGFTVTSSFTSSAVPAPGSLALVGLGGLIAGRRRR